jgi:flagellar basal-body rod protein FlgG
MINAFYASKSGAKNYQYYLDAIANNIANVNTNGYKAQNVSFTDLLYNEKEGLQLGNGSKAIVTRDMSTSGVRSNDSGLSVMVEGDGFIAVQGANGEIAYTRSMELDVAEIGGVNYLLTSSGDFVLDNNLNKIVIGDPSAFTLRAPAEASGAEVGAYTVGVFDFVNPEALIALGNGKFTINEETGMAAMPDTNSQLVQNMSETSNVDLISEMTKMIVAQRGFQLNSQMIRTADEMEQIAVDLNT